MFSGHIVVCNCHFTIFFVATPSRHWGLTIFDFFWSLRGPWGYITLSRCRCCEARKLAGNQLCQQPQGARRIYWDPFGYGSSSMPYYIWASRTATAFLTAPYKTMSREWQYCSDSSATCTSQYTIAQIYLRGKCVWVVLIPCNGFKVCQRPRHTFLYVY